MGVLTLAKHFATGNARDLIALAQAIFPYCGLRCCDGVDQSAQRAVGGNVLDANALSESQNLRNPELSPSISRSQFEWDVVLCERLTDPLPLDLEWRLHPAPFEMNELSRWSLRT